MSTRARLTTAYALLLLATLVVFGVALSNVRQSRTNHVADEALAYAGSIGEQIRRFQTDTSACEMENELEALRLRSKASKGCPLTIIDTTNGQLLARPTRDLVKVLDKVPGYFLVFTTQNQLLYASAPMRDLSLQDQDAIDRVAANLATRVEDARVRVQNDSTSLFIIADSVPTAAVPVPNISRVVVGKPFSFEDLMPPAITGTIVILAPLLFLLSVVAAYAVLGGVLRPVDALINEVEAITDGRSLHRRLQMAPGSGDELGRLTMTLNAMLMRLETSFAALRRFTADASHELKTPLTVLRADVERAMHPGTNRADKMIALEEALQETARMADLVDSLLTLARADEGRFDIYPVPVEIEPLMREIYETAVILGEDAGLHLSMPTLENAVVMGDRTRLRQLLLNLVTNAIKYTPSGGRVELAVTRRPNSEIAITVRDTGIGISVSDLPHVFDRFFRADRARSRVPERGVGGSGLGLAISQWIVQAHGGTVTVQSRLGRGSLFTVVLPAIAEPAEIPESVSEGTKVPETAKG